MKLIGHCSKRNKDEINIRRSKEFPDQRDRKKTTE